MEAIFTWLFGAPGASALAACMNWRVDYLTLRVASDLLIAASFFALPAGIVWLVRRRTDLGRQQRALAWLCGSFIMLCGLAHLIEVISLWYPIYGVEGLAKAAAAIVSVATVAFVWPLLPAFARLPSQQQLREANQRMRHETAAHESTLRELETAHRELEGRVAERTRELSLVKARFETALRGANVYVFSQDRDLRHTWVYSPHGDAEAAAMVGHTDEELLPAAERDGIIALKRAVIETGEPRDGELSYPLPEGRGLFALRVDPAFGADGRVAGVTCAAIDVSRLRSLESEQRRLAGELRTALQRYEVALRGSHVTVFTNDDELRYTSLSNAMFGRAADDIVGRTDEEILAAPDRADLIAAKKKALASGAAARTEVHVGEHWYDLHVEPMRDIAGDIVGLAGAAVDVTERKQNEAHLRLLMRELTHRSKNLLAVIQAMARQTANHAPSIAVFLDQFNARLQALATSHDLLVQESWHGASLAELIRLQLGHYFDRGSTQLDIAGPLVLLRPEAIQSLGLALHELATNAAKYGALSTPDGRVSVTWRRIQPDGPGSLEGVEIMWVESGGPPVDAPGRRGFGSLVIERNLSHALGADVKIAFPPQGAQCRIVVPAAQLFGAG